MDTKLSPIHVRGLLHYRYGTTSFSLAEGYSRAAEEVDMWLLANDLANVEDFMLTPRGEAMVDHILNTPLPIATFKVERGKE